MTTDTKQILCVKCGTGYSADYVNRLYVMVARNITGPFRVVCLTDAADGIRPEVHCVPLPELGCPFPERTWGKWRKLVLWSRELDGLAGTALFVDLDSIVLDNLDPYFAYGSPADVIMARNWARPLAKLGQSSVFRFQIGSHPEILERFRADPQGVADRFRYEQHYVTHSVKNVMKFWPEGWTRHFRIHCLGAVPLRYLRPARFPRGARIVTFPGGPNPGDVADGRWSAEAPPYRGRLAHLLATFHPARRTDAKPLAHLKHFAMPVPWIREYWKE